MGNGRFSVDKHVTVVGVLHIGMGAVMALVGLIVFMMMIGVGFLSGDREAMRVLPFVAIMVCGVMLVTGLPAIIGGFGLLKHKNWARILLMVVAAVDLLNMPVGTAIGVYTLWTLMQDEVEALFREDLLPD